MTPIEKLAILFFAGKVEGGPLLCADDSVLKRIADTLPPPTDEEVQAAAEVGQRLNSALPSAAEVAAAFQAFGRGLRGAT